MRRLACVWDAGGSIGTSNPLNPNPDANFNAIGLEVGTVAAVAGQVIYLTNSGNLTIGHVDSITITVTSYRGAVPQYYYPGSSQPYPDQLDDLETTNVRSSSLSNTGTLTVTEGNDNDNVGV